jgi:hypothetical protein
VSWWEWLTGAGATPNANVGAPDSVGPTYRPGDPNQAVLEDGAAAETRMATVVSSPWDGWPANWATPAWSAAGSTQLQELTDVAWAALDLNASVLSAMPVYRVRNGRVLPPAAWMTNPDPDIYTDWSEFAKQLFWDFQAVGEAFVLPMARASDGWPYTARVIPPPLVTADPEVRPGDRPGAESDAGERPPRSVVGVADPEPGRPVETGCAVRWGESESAAAHPAGDGADGADAIQRGPDIGAAGLPAVPARSPDR